MEPIIDHIQITVQDLETAIPFYDQLMPLLGFDPKRRVDATIEDHDFRVVDYCHERLCFAITSPRKAFQDDEVHRRKPGSLHHLAFKVDTPEEVDQFAEGLRGIGANIVSGPKHHPEYSPHYYAVFFKDPGGIKFEVVYDAHPPAQPSAQEG